LRIDQIYSHLNGLEFLQVHHPGLWQEIQNVIAGVNAANHQTKISQEARTLGRAFYSPRTMNQAFKDAFENCGWVDTRTDYFVTKDVQLSRQTMGLERAEQKNIIEAAGQVAIASYNQTDFVKNRVAVEVQFGKYSFVAYDLFVKHMAFFVAGTIDLGIEILPMKALQSFMSSGPSYYEKELYNLLRQGRGVPAVPLIVIGVAP